MADRQRLKNRGLFCLTKAKLKGLKIGAFLSVKRTTLSYSPNKVREI